MSANVEVSHSHETEASTHKALFSTLPGRWIYVCGPVKDMGWNGAGALVPYFLKLKSRYVQFVQLLQEVTDLKYTPGFK